MRLLGVGVVLRRKCLMRFSQTGNASTRPGRARVPADKGEGRSPSAIGP